MNIDYHEIIDTAEDYLDNIKTLNEICHYTKINAFESIADTCFQKASFNYVHFWFTSAYNTNDKHELLSGFDFMMSSFSAIEKTIMSSDNKFRISGISKDLIQSKNIKTSRWML